MPTRKCCCLGCELGSDDFNRANSNPPTGNWHVVSGEWEILNNELNCITTGVLATTICHPTVYDNGSYISTMKLVGMTSGAITEWEVGVGDPSSPDYVVEVIHNFATSQATLKLWSGNKSSVRHERTYDGVSEDATLTICYAPGLAIDVEIGFIPPLEFCDNHIGERCYTLSGTNVGGFSFRKGRFDDWDYVVHWLDNKACPKCPCFCEKSNTDYSCFPEILYLSFVSVGPLGAVLNQVPLYQSFLDPTSYLWPEKVNWYSETQNCGSPVNAQWTARFSCGQQDLGSLAFGTGDHNFEDTSDSQIVFSWVDSSPPHSAFEPKNAIKASSTCDPLSLVFPDVSINSAFPSPICNDPPCDVDGCHTPYCTDLNDQCYGSIPSIIFSPRITA